MSKQIQNDSWEKLIEIFNCLDENNVAKAVEEFKVKQICVDGITSKIYGMKDVKLACFIELLEKLGFSEEEIDKKRLCVIGDCKYTTDMYGILNHFIGFHDVPAQNIGKLVTVLKNDVRELPSKTEMVVYNLLHPHMSTD